MQENPIILTLYNMYPRFQELAGERWADLAEPLLALMAELGEARSSEQQDLICYQIIALLKTVPALIELFDREMDVFDPSTGPQITKNSLSNFFQGFRRKRKGSGLAIRRFVDISCPRKVWLQSSRVTVVVRLSESHTELSDAPEQALLLKEQPVQVRLEAPDEDFLLLGPCEQELTLPAAAPVSAPLVFYLTPRRVCFSTIRCFFTQDGTHLGITVLPVEITAFEVSFQDQEPVETLLETAGQGEAPDFTLYITCVPPTDPQELHFHLLQRGQSVWQKFAPVKLTGSLEDYAHNIYRRLTALVYQLNPTSLAVLGSRQTLSTQAAEESLRREGLHLWEKLLPLELRERYEREREQWINRSLLIISDEPHIPWELLWPDEDQPPLCLQMNLARWLQPGPQERIVYQPRQQFSLLCLGVIAPDDAGLAFASTEQAFLLTFMHQHQFQNVSPWPPTLTNVQRFLQEESYDWVHFAAHGNFYPDDPHGESAIWLRDQQSLTPQHIIGKVARAIRQQRPAFVLNACEVGRQGWAINGLGGWARSLISAGAGLFLAPLWPVRDDSAYRFMASLYQSLADKKAIAEAVRQARLDCQRAGDPTWLAYSLYAHPNARHE